MADNYLEKRYEEVFLSGNSNSRPKKSAGTKSLSLNSLLLKNRSHRVYDQNYLVSKDQLKEIVDVCWKIPSARNQQVLRYHLVTRAESSLVPEYEVLLRNVRFGGHSTLQGIAPSAFIVICSLVAETHYVSVDLGIAAQSMLLRAVEMGLRGICIGAFNKEAVRAELGLKCEPLLILGIGRSEEKMQLTHIAEGEDQHYYEKEGIHYIPKLSLEDLII